MTVIQAQNCSVLVIMFIISTILSLDSLSNLAEGELPLSLRAAVIAYVYIATTPFAFPLRDASSWICVLVLLHLMELA